MQKIDNCCMYNFADKNNFARKMSHNKTQNDILEIVKV